MARVGLQIIEGEKNELSIKEIFIKMISENFEYFPSLFEIQQGICMAFEQQMASKILNKKDLSEEEKNK